MVNEQLLKLSGVLVKPESDTSVNRRFGFFLTKAYFRRKKAYFTRKKAYFRREKHISQEIKHISGEKSIY